MAKLVTDPERAYRVARATVSDIALYNAQKVKEGIEKDTFFDILKDELEEGRTHFMETVAEEVPNRAHLYDRAIVDVMLKQAGKIPSPIW